jgi:hypothetical protein
MATGRLSFLWATVNVGTGLGTVTGVMPLCVKRLGV